MKEDRQDDLTTLIFYICIGAFLIISGIMILSIKIWSDISNVSMKYGFLKKIGMETKEIKKNVKKGTFAFFMDRIYTFDCNKWWCFESYYMER